MNTRTVLALFTATAMACGGAAEPMPRRPNLATSLVVEAESLASVVPVEGTVVARRTADISTRMMARISDVAVDIGAPVRAGQTMIRLGVDDVAAIRSSAEAAGTVARAARDEAAKQAARMDTLYTQDAVSLVQRDGARLALTQADAQLAMARSALQEVATAESYASLRAPFDGFVVSRFVDAGDVAHPGIPLLTVEATGPRDAVLAVPAEVAKQVSEGDTITVSSRDGRSIDAPVRAVSAGADPRSRTVQILVSLPADWPTGIAVTALVPSGIREGIAIPMNAVVRRGQLTGVRVATEDGVLLRWIRLGRTLPGPEGDQSRIEVLSGLEAGERIVP